jgi:hypothetical protein
MLAAQIQKSADKAVAAISVLVRAARPAAVAALLDLQDDYRAWLDSLPANLESSRLAEKLQAIVELDLDELETIDPPRGYCRD